LEEGLNKEPDEVVPYKILPFAVQSVEEVARSRLALFNGMGNPQVDPGDRPAMVAVLGVDAWRRGSTVKVTR
jgi:hypothetical protein